MIAFDTNVLVYATVSLTNERWAPTSNANVTRIPRNPPSDEVRGVERGTAAMISIRSSTKRLTGGILELFSFEALARRVFSRTRVHGLPGSYRYALYA
jgi:hypothetical protein